MHLLPAIIFLIFFIRIKNPYEVSFISKLQIFGSYNYFAGIANYCLWGLCNWCGSGGVIVSILSIFLLTVISHILQRSCKKKMAFLKLLCIKYLLLWYQSIERYCNIESALLTCYNKQSSELFIVEVTRQLFAYFWRDKKTMKNIKLLFL